MKAAYALTDGRCDATVLASIRALGYDDDFASVIARDAIDAATTPAPLGRTPGMDAVEVDELRGTITLPAGIGLDPGAIGKGLGADIIVDELLDAGATGVLVSLGGDIVMGGRPGDDPQWAIAIVDERRSGDDRIIDTLTFEPGIERAAVATSTTLKRRWAGGRHHLIDPSTGGMATGDLVQATVRAEFGWQAEAGATAALLLGSQDAPAWLDAHDMDGLLLTADTLVGASHA